MFIEYYPSHYLFTRINVQNGTNPTKPVYLHLCDFPSTDSYITLLQFNSKLPNFLFFLCFLYAPISLFVSVFCFSLYCLKTFITKNNTYCKINVKHYKTKIWKYMPMQPQKMAISTNWN